jgi:hypothetical protein
VLCADLVNNSEKYALMSSASTGARNNNDDGTQGPGTNAAEVATGESGLNDWIHSNIEYAAWRCDSACSEP